MQSFKKIMIDIDMDKIEKLKFITATIKTLGDSRKKFNDNSDIKERADNIYGELLKKLQNMLEIEDSK